MAAHPFSRSDVFGFGLAMEGECNSFWGRVPDARGLAAQSGRNQIHRWVRCAHHDLVVVVTLCRRGVARRRLLWRHNFETKYIDGFATLTMTSWFLDALVGGSDRS